MSRQSNCSMRRALALAATAIPLVSAVSCPYIAGNHARSPHPEAIIEPRYSEDGPNFGRCPRKSTVAGGGTRNTDWWPCELNLAVLRQNAAISNPLGEEFHYAAEFANLDVEQLRQDLTELQTTSQDWWPADFGDYGPFLIRLAWHSAGTYRAIDGRGGSGMGQIRFAPLNSWPDNANLDKARRLLWPIKQKYGDSLSWADLIVFAGDLAMQNMGFPSHGFAFGREDTWQADEAIYWGSEHQMFPEERSDYERYNGSTDIHDRSDQLESPLGSVNMGLIYVDPRGPRGTPDPLASAGDIRMTFGRMGMNDEETVALIAGGHAFGKTHGAVAASNVGPEPNAASIHQLGLGWHNSFGTGSGNNTHTSGLEVIWSRTPTEWANDFLNSLFRNNWTLVESPDGAPQWEALEAEANYPDPFDENKFHRPTMLTSDLALLHDPIYHNISQGYMNNFDDFTEKFGHAWFKLLHRDMGPRARYLGPYVPSEVFVWQDPLPVVDHDTIDAADIAVLKGMILNNNALNISNLVTTAWGAASSFRISDKRGGANGARIALQPQRSFPVNNPERLDTVLGELETIARQFNGNSTHKRVSLADLIVLGGTAAVEKAAADAGVTVEVPFSPGRVDATQENTDIEGFSYLEPRADGFRNYGVGSPRDLTEEILVDKANQLSLTPPELTVLVGGMRALDANFDGSKHGVFTNRPGVLTNDFFTQLLDISTVWAPIENTNEELFQGTNVATGVNFTATRADLVFGSHPELRAISEVYAGSGQKFANAFVKAWVKVMDLDRYDLRV
ncbi:catalase D [Stachybotrys elegans]|uniref:Catalase-peroxidase n=1 Tax=Stachybotrys elegans TaxID=80388 RepID=A0A8K0SP65_9HYPO|nr:catalase D [Stachybotrys elegans]